MELRVYKYLSYCGVILLTISCVAATNLRQQNEKVHNIILVYRLFIDGKLQDNQFESNCQKTPMEIGNGNNNGFLNYGDLNVAVLSTPVIDGDYSKERNVAAIQHNKKIMTLIVDAKDLEYGSLYIDSLEFKKGSYSLLIPEKENQTKTSLKSKISRLMKWKNYNVLLTPDCGKCDINYQRMLDEKSYKKQNFFKRNYIVLGQQNIFTNQEYKDMKEKTYIKK